MRNRLVLAWVMPLALAACAGKGPLQRSDPAGACAELVMPVKARLIKLPTGGAIMESATPVAAVDQAPEHCQVLGRIVPIDKTTPPIRFQVSLPMQWNGQAAQYGGVKDAPAQLALGYTTYGFEAGAERTTEAPTGLTHDTNKKVRDVAVQLMMRAYGRGPQKLYFVGEQEGLAMVQRYPNDYDGILSEVRAAPAPVESSAPQGCVPGSTTKEPSCP